MFKLYLKYVIFYLIAKLRLCSFDIFCLNRPSNTFKFSNGSDMKKYCMVFSFVSLLYAFGAFAQLKSGEPFFKVNRITISVNNLDSMKQWYVSMLNARVIRERHSDTSQYVRIGIGDFLLTRSMPSWFMFI